MLIEKSLVSYYVDKPLDIVAADAVSNIVDLRCFADFSGNIIIKTMSQKLNCCSGSQIEPPIPITRRTSESS